MIASIILVALFASVFGIFYLYITARSRERMAMIEKGVEASLFALPKQNAIRPRNSSFRFSLKAGSLIVGTGIGFIISYILYVSLFPAGRMDYHPQANLFPLVVVGIVFVCGGLGLITGYYLGRRMDQSDFKE